MSWFWGSDSNEDVGNEVLKSYFYEAQKFPEFTYPDYESWITWANSRVPDYVTVIGELVNGSLASSSVGSSKERVTQLANSTGGQASLTQIVQAAGSKGESINWMQAIPEVGGETVVDLAQYASDTAQAVGQGVMSTTKLVKYLPWILGAGAAIYIFTIAKGQRGLLDKFLK